MISSPGRKTVVKYPCCPEPYPDLTRPYPDPSVPGLALPYPDLTFVIAIQRIPIFYVIVLIIPCILLSLLTLVSFWLPPETPAKILLGNDHAEHNLLFRRFDYTFDVLTVQAS